MISIFQREKKNIERKLVTVSSLYRSTVMIKHKKLNSFLYKYGKREICSQVGDALSGILLKFSLYGQNTITINSWSRLKVPCSGENSEQNNWPNQLRTKSLNNECYHFSQYSLKVCKFSELEISAAISERLHIAVSKSVNLSLS